MNKQGKAWVGKFGDQYTERNETGYRNRLPIWRGILKEFGPTYPQLSVLEVGCNRGYNLRALSFLGVGCGKFLYPTGIDINKSALDIARKTYCAVQYGDALSIPFEDNSFDLVFTMGVLIHIAPENLHIAIQEMYRVSKQYILAIEYPAEEETEISYRGHNNLLWKRDFLHEFKALYPDLPLIDHQLWGTGNNPTCDKMDSWLFEKNNVHY